MQLRLQLAITVQNLYEPVIMINIHLAILKRWGPPYIDVLTDYLIVTLNKDVFTNILIVHFSGKSKLENHKFKTRGENYVPHQPALVFLGQQAISHGGLMLPWSNLPQLKLFIIIFIKFSLPNMLIKDLNGLCWS